MRVGRETGRVFGLGALFLVLAGCDPAGASRVPAPPLVGVVAKPAVATAAPSQTIRIALVVPAESSDTIRAWIQVVREQAGKRGVFFELKEPQPGEPPAQEAELIREAVRQGARALIVVASESDEVSRALTEANSKNVPIVLLGRRVKVEGKPPVNITTTSLDESARTLVSGALADAKTSGSTTDAPAMVLVNSKLDELSQERQDALKHALEKAGVKQVLVVPYGVGEATPDARHAQASVEQTFDAHHDLSMVLAADDDGLSGAVQARYSTEANSKFVVAGFAARPTSSNLSVIREASVVIETRVLKMAEQATDAAVRMAKGEKVDPEIVIAHRTRRAVGPRPQGGAARMLGVSAPPTRQSTQKGDAPQIAPPPPVKD